MKFNYNLFIYFYSLLKLYFVPYVFFLLGGGGGDEKISPYVKLFECLEKRYINVTFIMYRITYAVLKLGYKHEPRYLLSNWW